MQFDRRLPLGAALTLAATNPALVPGNLFIDGSLLSTLLYFWTVIKQFCQVYLFGHFTLN